MEISSAVKQVINNCMVSQNVDVEKLEVFDLEYIMLQLRIISVGETTKISFSALEDSTCDECKKIKEIEINLKEVKVNFKSNFNNKIELTNDIGIIMKYPNHKALAIFSKTMSEPNAELKLLWSCVESVYDSTVVTSAKDVTADEGIQFLEALTTQQFRKIEEFIETMPQLSHEVALECNSCGKTQSHVIRGLDNFLV
jgi:hypothetical protein